MKTSNIFFAPNKTIFLPIYLLQQLSRKLLIKTVSSWMR